jgi:hypothetical protein
MMCPKALLIPCSVLGWNCNLLLPLCLFWLSGMTNQNLPFLEVAMPLLIILLLLSMSSWIVVHGMFCVGM